MTFEVSKYAKISLKNVPIFFKWKNLFKSKSVTKNDLKHFMVPLLSYLVLILMPI